MLETGVCELSAVTCCSRNDRKKIKMEMVENVEGWDEARNKHDWNTGVA